MKKMEFGWADGQTEAIQTFAIDVDQNIKDKILDLVRKDININDSSLKLLFPSETPAGSYHLRNKKNEFFIRVSSRIGDFKLENEFVNYLRSRKIQLNEFTVGGINFDWDNQQYRLDVRPFLHGNSYFSNLDDFKKLIDCINQFHKIAFKFPNFAKIKSNQKQISEKQNQTRNKCLEALNKEKFNFFENHSGWAKNNQKWLTKILEEYNPYFEDMLGAQCLHGQIHPGNVLFVRGNPILFDTETSIHTFAPVEWDFSWVLQRFIINQELSNEDSLKFIKLLAKNKSEIAKLIYMAKLNTIYSVVAVFDYSINKSISVPQSELDKFYNNYMSLCDYELYLRDAYEI